MAKVTAVHGQWPAQYGKTRVSFSIEGDDRKISGFFPEAPAVGQEIEGEVVMKGEYVNWSPRGNFSGSRPSSPAFAVGGAELKNYLEFKIVPMLQVIHAKLERIERFTCPDDEMQVVPEKNIMPDFGEKDVTEDSPF